MTYTRVRVTFLHFFAIFIQMGGWNGKTGERRVFIIYILCIYMQNGGVLRYPMVILWVSYGYPMVRAARWQVKPSILYRYYAAFAF